MVRNLLLALFFLLALNGPAQSDNTPCPRVISQAPYITYTLQWMGLGHCIVGTSRYDDLGLPHTGGVLDPDAEAMSAVKADILFSSNWISADDLQLQIPAGLRAIRLQGFGSMQEVEQNIVTIGEAMGLDNARSYQLKFSKLWRAKAKQLQGNGKRILLISSCSGMPYSFGRERWLSDFFTYGGFKVVETHPTIRQLRPGQEIEQLNDLIQQTRPDVVFILTRGKGDHCQLVLPADRRKIISIDAPQLFHPAPVMLEGIDILLQQKHQWQSHV